MDTVQLAADSATSPRETEAQPQSLGRRIATGATWMVLQRIAVRGIGLVSTMMLARLLLPADFGIVALATGFSAILDSLFEFGFDLALIHSQSTDRTQYDSAWTLSVIRGFVTAVLLLLIASPVASLYSDRRLIGVLLWLAVSSIASGFQNVGIVEFRRDLLFDFEFRLLVRSKIVGFMVTIALAWWWRDYRALIAGIVASKFATLVLSYTMHRYRPSFSLAGSRAFLHFSKWLCLDNIVAAVRSRSDTFFVAKIAGAGVLGFYALAYEISNLTATELVWPISRVLFPGFAKMAGDPQRLARGFIESLAVIIFIAAPMAAGIAMTADYIVAIFLGPKWMPVIPLIQILTFYGLLNLTSANGSALYLSLGRPDLIVWRNLPAIAVLIPALVIGVWQFGAAGAAWALVLSAAVNFFVNFAFLHRHLRITAAALAAAVWRPVAAAAGMAAVLVLVKHAWPIASTIPTVIPQLAAVAIMGAAVYVGLVMTLWLLCAKPWGAERRLLELVQGFIRR